MNEERKGRDLFIVDNSVSGWTALRFLEEWTEIAKGFDIATGYFDIGTMLALDGKWQSLSKIRILMLGGDILVESEVGKGTVFRVALQPASAETEVKEVEAVKPMAVGRRGRILVVDDEPALCKTIQRTLSNDHEIVVVMSARQALDMVVAGDRFDAILSDLMMPEMTGMELHAALARSLPDQAGRMIFMTGGVFSPDAAAFLQQKSHPWIEKPFRPTVLRETLQKVLQRHGTHH